MSVSSGSPVRSLTAANVLSPSRSPGPRNDLPEVRLALSNDALNTTGIRSRSASPASVSAMRSVNSCDSMTHGPRIHKSGRPAPHTASPTCTDCIAFMTSPPWRSPDLCLQFHRQPIDLGGQDEIVLRQPANGMRGQFDGHVAVAGQVQVGMVIFRLGNLADTGEEVK